MRSLLSDKVRSFVFLQDLNGFLFPRSVLLVTLEPAIQIKCSPPGGERGPRQREINQKRVASRHEAISCPDGFFSLLIFQRSSGDFTVTFSDSYVSHYMWVGVSAVIRPAVLFSPLHPQLPTPPQ